jgi:VanZ family protein
LTRIVCIGYAVFLTLLLLTSDPARLIGCQGGLPQLLQTLMPWAHVISFSVLAALALMTRWPMPRWTIVLILAVYGGMTEIIQSRVPSRTPEWMDWFQDLAGIAIGAACCWAVAMFMRRFAKTKRTQTSAALPPTNHWEAMRNMLQRSTVKERSWWN